MVGIVLVTNNYERTVISPVVSIELLITTNMDRKVIKFLITILLFKITISAPTPLSAKRDLSFDIETGKVSYNVDSSNFGRKTNSTSQNYNHLELIAISKYENDRLQLRLKWTLEEMCFMFIILILLLFHLAFLEYFIRIARTRFQNNRRFNFYATVSVIFAFLVAIINMMMVMRFFQHDQMCY